MAPFIKLTDASQAAKQFVYLNAAHIVKATYNEDAGTLLIVVDHRNQTGGHPDNFTLSGDEATAALEIIRKL